MSSSTNKSKVQTFLPHLWKKYIALYYCSICSIDLCFSGNITNYTLVEINKTWCQAREYCRNKRSDLVSISNNVQNDQVIEKGNNRSFWIGLMHDEWEWEDKGCSSFRKWIGPKQCCCAIQSNYGLDPKMRRHDCLHFVCLFCSRGKQNKTKSTQLLAFNATLNMKTHDQMGFTLCHIKQHVQHTASDAEWTIRQLHEPDITTVPMIIILYLRGKVYISIKHN